MNKNDAVYVDYAYTRTDLACEAGRPETHRHEERVFLADGYEDVTILRCREHDGRRYITLSCGRVTLLGEAALSALCRILGDEMRKLAAEMLGYQPRENTRILVAGLGNADMTPDAIGPGTVRRLTATRHMKSQDRALYGSLGCCELSAVMPGVLGQTGIESVTLVQGAAEYVKPHLVLAVDALAARSCDRLATTVQLSDGGISPGAGIGNNRLALDHESMGCPVIGIGIPTVVDSATLVYDALSNAGMAEKLSPALEAVLEQGRSFVVSPKDGDSITEISCRLLAGAINYAFGVGML
ncbi:MAG: GPR endopeptidase [Ruminococcaceae bacterium]|nr:GPR endopeptidase [Oscillospiraceae bacterium]